MEADISRAFDASIVGIARIEYIILTISIL